MNQTLTEHARITRLQTDMSEEFWAGGELCMPSSKQFTIYNH